MAIYCFHVNTSSIQIAAVLSVCELLSVLPRLGGPLKRLCSDTAPSSLNWRIPLRLADRLVIRRRRIG